MSPELGSPRTEAAVPSKNGADPLRMPDGALVAKRDAPVGGQAVLEGVMMRGISVWAVAVRRGLATVEWPGRLQRLTSGPLPAMLPTGLELDLSDST